MNALTNAAAAGDSGLPPHLADPDLAIEADLSAPTEPGSDTWRSEVAARLARYRTRRKPRAPRYPSLMLPFDSSESWTRPTAAGTSIPVVESVPTAAGPDHDDTVSEQKYGADAPAAFRPGLEPEPATNVIEFPRSAAIPLFHADPLADPIFERPRILEAPEVVPPPPALGGILIEPADREAQDRRAGDLMPSAASIPQRLLAALIDGLIIAASLAAFGAVFLRFNPIAEPTAIVVAASGGLAVLLWMSYQFCFLIFTASTPGLRAAGLKLSGFGGSVVDRPTRRWRVLASFLSGFSAGLGYLWCFLDEDSLSWHDRITRTYVRSVR